MQARFFMLEHFPSVVGRLLDRRTNYLTIRLMNSLFQYLFISTNKHFSVGNYRHKSLGHDLLALTNLHKQFWHLAYFAFLLTRWRGSKQKCLLEMINSSSIKWLWKLAGLMATIKINFTLKTTEEIFPKKTLISVKHFYLMKILEGNMTLNNVFIMRCWGELSKKTTKGYLRYFDFLSAWMCVERLQNALTVTPNFLSESYASHHRENVSS